MKAAKPPESNALEKQYSDSRALRTRIALHRRFSTSDYGWPRWLFEHIDPRAGSSVLEVGCGPATLWQSNLERVPGDIDLTLSDLYAGMIVEAHRNTQGRFRYAVADSQHLPFANESFDLVIANHMLYHVPDRPRAFTEIARVLRQGGSLVAATNGKRHLSEFDDLLARCGGPRAVDAHVDAFGLETGPPQLEARFTNISVERFEDSLRITEVQPLIDFLHSMTIFWAEGGLNLETEGCIRDIVEQEIAAKGFFHVHKDSGIIRAVRA